MDPLRLTADRIPDATEYFDFSARRFVGNTKRTVRAVAPSESFKYWELWVAQAFAALAKLHEAGLVHGSIDPSALVITDNNLRLGALQKVHEDTDLPVTDTFAPNNLLLPPEQNLWAAFQGAVPFQTAYTALSQANWSMDQLETIFPRIEFSRPAMFGLYEKIQSAPAYRDMQRAGDVWMLGFALLSRYYEMLEWPYAITAEFYQTKHEDFHDLIEQMVRINPVDRITVLEALGTWAPGEAKALKGSTASASASAAISETPVAATVEIAIEPPVAPVETPSETATVTAAVARPRPYLTLQSHPAGRNKTRRSLHN